ncbi:hypothetical protein LN040_12115 [Desulfovibrio subterraneus]|uniref:MoaD/ThiS family protein n=1 Tax=Desulfovibrio subterraneus TaxID=2718620 RepID=UPI0022B8A285|nr:MoaD/ThiS family protein [Desulfovibrio subterraneus]WBF66472.1 hypothetical protein LN040_12115 [Desulfovibrio subterraneus]
MSEQTYESAPYGVTVTLEPANETRVMQVKNVQQMLSQLQIRPTTVLVIRDGGLLTPDLKLQHGDKVTVRTVVSSG